MYRCDLMFVQPDSSGSHFETFWDLGPNQYICLKTRLKIKKRIRFLYVQR